MGRDSKKTSSKGSVSVLNPLKTHFSEIKSPVDKDIGSKKLNCKKAVPFPAKDKTQSELVRLKQEGDLKHFPKLSVDAPFMARRIRFVDAYIEDDQKWAYRFTYRDEYMKKDQDRQLDKFTKNYRVVYDQNERSPYYSDSDIVYIDERKLLPSKGSEEAAINLRFKTRGLKRNVLNNSVIKDKAYTSLNPYYIVQDESDKTLVFEGRFESGNLK